MSRKIFFISLIIFILPGFVSAQGKYSGGNDDGWASATLLNQPLPVVLVDFYGKSNGGMNYLYWITASEINSNYFEIEYSSDGQSFKKIGQVNAAGHSNVIRKYEFKDEQITVQDHYYHLKQVDLDGTVTCSKTIVLKSEWKDEIMLYPNPVKEELMVRKLPVESSWYDLLDMKGEVIRSGKLIKDKSIFTAYLPAGMYFIRINSRVTKFIKE